MEQLEFAVANLGNKDLFIGHEWLKAHNPNIDWRTLKVRFDHCPRECGYTEELQEPEDDTDGSEQEPIQLEPGERLYALDTDAYL